MEELDKKTLLFIDLDGTLIKTASGETLPEDCTDFRIRKEVLDKIAEVLMNLETIAIVTNQGGIPQFVSKSEFEAKLQGIIQFMEGYFVDKYMTRYLSHRFVIGLYCASTDKDDPMRKPNIGMLLQMYRYSYQNPTPNQMLMIGDASGKPGQFSDSDKKCAENFGIDYMDVEDFLKL